MEKLYFVTGNPNKFAEVKAILPRVEQLDIHLPEIQDTDARNIVWYKLLEAVNHIEGRLIVEDTSLYMECLNGLPGPLIRWFLKTIGHEGLADLAEKLGNDRAVAKTIVGYAKSPGEFRFFEGTVTGRIVRPRVEMGFDWDSIFLPDGHIRTFAEMGKEEKNMISMRRLAINYLKIYLNSNG